MSPGRHAYFEDDDEGSSARYSHSWSSRSAQDVESKYPKKGKTRIPSHMVSKRALIDLSYPYMTEGNHVIVLKALGPKNIDELLRLSEEYQQYEYIFDDRDDVTDAARTNRKPEGVSRPDSPIVSHSRSPSPRRRAPLPWQQSSDPNPPAQTVQPPATNAYTKFRNASFNDVPLEERTFFTGTFQLNARERSPIFNQTNSGSSEGQRAWNSPKSFMCDGSISTELFGIHAAEYYMDHSLGHKVTLYCPNRPQGLDSKAPQVRMRWLHLQGVPSELSILEDLVTDCPFVSQDLKSVALKVLIMVSQRCEKASETGPEIENGAVIRFVGRYTSYGSRRVSTWDTEPVTFLSSPFLHLPEQKSKNPAAHTKTLREYLYDYDAGSILQEQMGAHNVTVGEEATSRTFHVPNTWSLIIGSSLFITFSPLSSAEVLGENIVFDQKALSSSHGIYTVRVIDERNQCRYHIVVDKDYNYVDFLRHAVDLTHSEGVDATTCIIADEAGELIDSASWLSLLTSGDIENHIFRLRQRDAKPTRDDEQKLRSFAMKLLTDGSSVSEDVERVLAESGPYSRQQLLLEYKPREINNQMMVYRPEIWPVRSEVGEASKPARHHISSERIENRQSESTEHPLEERLGGRLLIEDKPRISKTSLEAPQMLSPVFDGLETIFEVSSSLEAYMTEIPQTPSSEKRIPAVKASDSLPTLLPWTKDTPAAGTQSEFDYPTPEENSLFASAAMSSVSLPQHSPFLTWKMDWNEQTRTKIEKDQALVQLLNGIHESIMSSNHRKIYLETLQCTARSVSKRCQILGISPNPTERMDIFRSEVEGSPRLGSQDYVTSPGPTSADNEEVGVESVSSLSHAIVQTSSEILGDFLPTTDSCSIHPLVIRFWGAIETILRQIRLASVRSNPRVKCAWVIISEEVPEPEGGMSDGHLRTRDCLTCRHDFEYDSLQGAVDHLHMHHVKCPKATGPAGLVEDPCVGWVREISRDFPRQLDDAIAPAARAFLDSVQGMRMKTRDLHFSICSTSTGESNDNMHLLTNLVLAFEKLVARYILAAKELSWVNRAAAETPQDRVNPRALELIRGWGVKAEQDIHDLLQQAKRDIILMGSTYHDIDRLIIAPIGPEFLLASLVRNTQNDAILQGMKRKIDVVKYYRNFTNKTRFGAVRDPKRQRFLEISALEEELETLRMIIHVQKEFLGFWGHILSPEGFYTATTEWTYIKDREAMYPLESKLIWSQQKKLSDDDKALEGLQDISNALRLNLKQSLEILEEGHGKAIRVFTIVTLFFLPLSFVTSFFGMNTTDVRDTDWDQRIFWSCALPVTFGVLTLAFVYSYKWDMIMEMSFRRLPSTTRTKSPCHILEDDMIPLTGNRNLKKPKQSQMHEEQSSKMRAKVFVSKLRRRPSTKPGTVQRRQTGDSLLY